MTSSEMAEQARRVIAKAWTDEGFRARLLADPEAALKAEGVAVPAGLKLVAHEDTAQIRHLVLPAKPDGEMADAELEMMAGGIRTEEERGGIFDIEPVGSSPGVRTGYELP